MWVRVLSICGGLLGAATLAQMPQYSKQYIQHLDGAVVKLRSAVSRFDSDTETLGLSRENALDQLAVGNDMSAAQARSMRYVLVREERLSRDLEALRRSGSYARTGEILRLSDREIARKAWGDFRPGLPKDGEGVVFAGVGYLLGNVLVGGILALILMPFRRRERAKMRKRAGTSPPD